jgi:prephenate dehydratase
MLLDVPERQGALFKSLAPFWLTGTNITTLHSSFVEESDFTERFFIEFEAGVQARKTKFILAALRKLGAETTILGSYRRNEAYHKTKGVMA